MTDHTKSTFVQPARNGISAWGLLLLAMVIALPAVGMAMDFYVSSSGNNGNLGTSPLQAWKDFTNVNSRTFLPGDRILLNGGQAFTGPLVLGADDAGTSALPITISSFGTGRATIQAAFYGAPTYTYSHAIAITDTAGVVISDINLSSTAKVNWYTGAGSGIHFKTYKPSGYLDYVRINNCDIYGFGEAGIEFDAYGWPSFVNSGYRDVQVTNVLSHDNYHAGMTVYGSITSNYKNHSNFYVADSSFFNNSGYSRSSPSGDGLALANIDTATVERCTAYGNGSGNTYGAGPVGIWCYEANNVTIQHCESYNNSGGTGNDGDGFDFDGGTTNSVLQYNYSHGNTGAGYLFSNYGSLTHSGNVVRYNISENDAVKNYGYTAYGAVTVWAINSASPFGANHVYNNTFYVGASTNAYAAGVFFTNNYINGTGFKFWNNIIVTAGSRPMVAHGSGFLPTTTKALFQGNLYYATGTFTLPWNGTNYGSLAAWRATGQEPGSLGLSANPLLAGPIPANRAINNAANLASLTEYKLQSGSPARDSAFAVTSVTGTFGVAPGPNDYYSISLPQATYYDMGAHEFQAVIPSPTPTSTVTPVQSPTASPSASPTPAAMLWEDFALGLRNGWAGGDGAGSTAAVTLTASPFYGNGNSATFQANTLAGGWAYGGFGTNYPTGAQTGQTETGSTALKFWVMADANATVQVELHNTNANKWKSPAFTITGQPGIWQEITVSLAATPALVLANVDYWGLVFGANISNATLVVDQISFSNQALPTATPTPSATACGAPGFPVKYEDMELTPLNGAYAGPDGAGSSVTMTTSAGAARNGSNGEAFSVTTLPSGGWAYGGFGTRYASCGAGIQAGGATMLTFSVRTDSALPVQVELHNGANKWKSSPFVIPAAVGAWQTITMVMAGVPASVTASVDYFGLVFGAGISSATVAVDDVWFINDPLPWPRRWEDFDSGAASNPIYPYNYGGAAVPVTSTTMHGGTYAADISITNSAGSGAGFGTNYPTAGQVGQDVTGATKLSFWVKVPAAVTLTVSIKEGNAPGSSPLNEVWSSHPLTVSAGAWQYLEVPLNTMSTANATGNGLLDLGNIQTFDIYIDGQVTNGHVYVDDIYYWNDLVPTLTPSPSRTPTASPTLAFSATSTSTLTPSPSLTATCSASPTSTVSPVYSPTPTATQTPSFTASPSFSASPTHTATASVTPSFSASPSATRSASPSPSLTASPSRTVTPTLSPTPSVSPSFTPTLSPTWTPLASATFTPPPSTATFTPQPVTAGIPDVLELRPVPNPQKGSEMVLAFKLKADADHVVVKMYTVNLAAVERRELQGPWLAGWNRLSMGLTGAPSSGLYYVVLETRNAQGMGRGAIARLVYLQ